MRKKGSPVAFALLFSAGCGYVGGPQLPLANVPQKITDLTAVQRGDLLIVRCTMPTRTTENVLIKTPLKLDLRMGTASDHFDAGEWASQAKAISGAQVKEGNAVYRIPIKEWIGKEVVLGVDAIGANNKQSGWSNYQAVPIVAPPEIPSKPTLTPVPLGVRISWTGRGDQFRILRRSGAEEGFSVAMTLTEHEWIDTSIEFGKPYTYEIQALVNLGNQKTAESDPSPREPKTFTDIFPPAVPTGLRADPTPTSVSLAWEGDTEPDLAGYHVYRSEGDGPWQKLADVNSVPTYSDIAIEHGKKYRYAVSAFDKSGNESERSAPVEIVP